MSSHNLKHALSSILSIIVSTPQGIEYILKPNQKSVDVEVLEKIIEHLKEQVDGSVTQRFFIAII